MQVIEQVREIVAQAKRMVFFGGAGVSTESGILDFRSVDGLYHQKYDVPPETILSHSYFLHYPEAFYRFYREKMLCLTAEPNTAHRKLAQWEQDGKLTAVITQNIDGLHQKAGSRHVLELHGSVLRNYCMQCGRAYDVSVIADSEGLPLCSCGGLIKPDVVLYEEALDSDVMEEAEGQIRQADVMIVGGTSLAVYPAAGLLHDFKGDACILVNRDPTPFDAKADVVIHGKIGEVFAQL